MFSGSDWVFPADLADQKARRYSRIEKSTEASARICVYSISGNLRENLTVVQ